MFVVANAIRAIEGKGIPFSLIYLAISSGGLWKLSTPSFTGMDKTRNGNVIHVRCVEYV